MYEKSGTRLIIRQMTEGIKEKPVAIRGTKMYFKFLFIYLFCLIVVYFSSTVEYSHRNKKHYEISEF